MFLLERTGDVEGAMASVVSALDSRTAEMKKSYLRQQSYDVEVKSQQSFYSFSPLDSDLLSHFFRLSFYSFSLVFSEGDLLTSLVSTIIF
jgi:hypothetical protein